MFDCVNLFWASMPEGDPEKLQDTTATPDRERGTSTHHRNPGAADESIEGIDFPRYVQSRGSDVVRGHSRGAGGVRRQNELALAKTLWVSLTCHHKGKHSILNAVVTCSGRYGLLCRYVSFGSLSW